jgi:hypothetical protein
VRPHHQGIAYPGVADTGNALQIRRVPANILNKQSRMADKGWYFSLRVGRMADNSSKQKKKKVTQGLGIGRIL